MTGGATASADPRRWLVLAICCSSLFIVGMDVSIVNVALPAIRMDFGADISGLQWTIDAYTLVLASLLVLSGSLGDRFGRRRTFQTGLTLFSIGSLLCSLAPSLEWLVVFRIVQAVGGSMLNPVALSIISNTFLDAKERARALGVWSAVAGLSLSLGPVIGGALVDSIGWRAIFWINVPIGIAAIVFSGLFVPESRGGAARRIDPLGQLIAIVLLSSLVFGIIELPDVATEAVLVPVMFAIAAASLVAFIVVERRVRDPLIDMRFFRSASFSGATIIAVLAFASLAGFLFLNTLYLQNVRGYTPLLAGLATLPMAAMNAAAAPLSGRIVAARGARIPLVLAGCCTAAGATLLAVTFTATTPLAVLLTAYVLLGLGLGMVNPPIANAAVSGMPRSRSGVAAAVASTGRQTGSSLGVAVIGAIVAVGTAQTAAFVSAGRAAWVLIACLGVVILIVGIVSTTRWAARTTASVSDLVADR